MLTLSVFSQKSYPVLRECGGCQAAETLPLFRDSIQTLTFSSFIFLPFSKNLPVCLSFKSVVCHPNSNQPKQNQLKNLYKYCLNKELARLGRLYSVLLLNYYERKAFKLKSYVLMPHGIYICTL